MTKLNRVEHKIFANEAPLKEMGQFGSAVATTKLNTKDIATIQALPAYAKGWGSAIVSNKNFPPMEEMNGVLNVMSYHTGYLYQEGIPAWTATQEYSSSSIVKDNGGTKLYKSLQDNNKGHALQEEAWWREMELGESSLKGKANTDLANTTPKLDNSFLDKLVPDYTKASTTSFKQGQTFVVPYHCEIAVCDYDSKGGFAFNLNSSSGIKIFTAGATGLVLSSDRIRLAKGTKLYVSQATSQGNVFHYIAPLVGAREV